MSTAIAAGLGVLSGCGGESGGVPSGIGGTLVNARVSANLLSLNLNQQVSDFNALPADILTGVNQNISKSTRMFDVVVKGGGLNGDDISFVFPKYENPSMMGFVSAGGFEEEVATDGTTYKARRLFLLVRGTDVLVLYRKRTAGVVTYYKSGTEEQVTLTADEATTIESRGQVVGYEGLTVRGMRRGKFDVAIRFFSDVEPVRGRAVDPNPFFSAYIPGGATVDSNQLITLRLPSSDVDPARRFSRPVDATVAVTGAPDAANAVRVRVYEINEDGSANTKVSYEATTDIAQAGAVPLTLINRLRPFKVEAEALLDNDVVLPSIALGRNHSAISIGANATKQSFSVDLETRLEATSLTADPISLAFDPENTTSNSKRFQLKLTVKEIPANGVFEKRPGMTFNIPESHATTDFTYTVGDNSGLVSVGNTGVYEVLKAGKATVAAGITDEGSLGFSDSLVVNKTTTSSGGVINVGSVGSPNSLTFTFDQIPPGTKSILIKVTESGSSPVNYEKIVTMPAGNPSFDVVERGFSFNGVFQAMAGEFGDGEVLSEVTQNGLQLAILNTITFTKTDSKFVLGDLTITALGATSAAGTQTLSRDGTYQLSYAVDSKAWPTAGFTVTADTDTVVNPDGSFKVTNAASQTAGTASVNVTYSPTGLDADKETKKFTFNVAPNQIISTNRNLPAWTQSYYLGGQETGGGAIAKQKYNTATDQVFTLDDHGNSITPTISINSKTDGTGVDLGRFTGSAFSFTGSNRFDVNWNNAGTGSTARLLTAIEALKVGTVDVEDAAFTVSRSNAYTLMPWATVSGTSSAVGARNFTFTTTIDPTLYTGLTGYSVADQALISVNADGVLTVGNLTASKTVRFIYVGVKFELGESLSFTDAFKTNSRLKVVKIRVKPNVGSGGGGVG